MNYCRISGSYSKTQHETSSKLHADFFIAYYSTLKMEATCSPETSVDFQRTTWCYNPRR
jgi:hypothetical protein